MNSRILSALLILAFSQLYLANPGVAQTTYRPTDPIASVDSSPVYLGELNYLLRTKLKVKKIDAVPIAVQRASSASLVRQHQALRTLKEQGGDSLQTILERSWNAFISDLQRQGTSIERYSKQHQSDPQSVRNSHDWDTAWRTYLKSKMTDANLRLFYKRHLDQYADTAWNVSHLFLPIERDQSDSASIAEQRMNRILRELESAESPADRSRKFADLARQESEGSTAKEGGRIGWVSKPGDLPAKVMSVIRQSEVGAVSPTIASPMGLHLVLVHETKSQPRPFESLTDLGRLRRDAANALFNALVEKGSQTRVIWYIKQLRSPSP